jgi:hypothetical protein
MPKNKQRRAMARRTKVAILIAAIMAGSLVAIIAAIVTTRAPNSGPGHTAPTAAGDSGILNLPRIAWEGGPAYWDQFSVTKAAGWNNPSFFPVVIWYDSVSSGAEVRADESYGINTYTGESAATDYHFYADNKAFTLDALSNAPTGGTAQPGLFIADEPDGRTTSANDLQTIKKLVASSSYDGRFKEINFSDTVISGSNPAANKANFEAMVNSYAGPVSVDKYYYTQPSCFDIRYMIVPIDPGHCRTSSSYGATVRAVRARLAATGRLKPVWNFIENLSGAPDPGHFYAYIQPGQLEGAVMDSIINEARGIIYFDESFAGSCQAGNVIRQVQIGARPCAAPQMNAMKEVDQRIKALAPVINTQSYEYTFGTNLDTMLKTYQNSAYIFSMISGAASSAPGRRTFTLPPRLADAASVQVLNENRTIPVVNGKFTDDFAHEYTYHIYKIAISGR